MSNPLFPCPGCARHVRVSTAACPFCSVILPANPVGVVPGVGGMTLGRAAIFAFASSVAACSSAQTADSTTTVAAQENTTAQQGVQPGGSVVQSPPVNQGSGASGDDPGAVVAAYGGPAPMMVADAGTMDAATPDAATPDAAPATDARADAQARPSRPPRDQGAIMVRYGGPPAEFA